MATRETDRENNKKILDADLCKAIQQLKQNDVFCKKTVFTNGCFDILHAGHVIYLENTAKLGDILIVGVCSDDTVRQMKGASRPVNGLEDRLVVLSSLACVDYVIPFEEEQLLDLIKAIRPDVLVKGRDYSIEKIVGAEFVQMNSGVVLTVPSIEGKSTTKIIERCRNI